MGNPNHGIPIGHPMYINSCMDKYKLKIEEFFTKITIRIPDNIQLQFSIILKTSIHRIMHLLRGLPFVQCEDLINHYNIVQKKWLCTALYFTQL